MVQNINKGYADKRVTVPCGQCIGCRLERSRVWAIRSVHEASLYDQNIFTTQTYSDENLPLGRSLVRKHFQDFMKRLRKKVPRVRVLYCGEYGDETDRPHYHAIIFNYRPDDAQLVAVRNGKKFYTSAKFDKIWEHGHCNFSDATFSSCAYVSGYVTKKVTGEKAEEHYQWIDPETGEIHQRQPPFQGQSLKPGIGQPWIEKWWRDVYGKDEIVIDGRPMRPPRYYDLWLEKNQPEMWREVQKRRSAYRTKIVKKEKEMRPGKIKTTYGPDVDPDEYKGSSRQLFAAMKIAKSRQRKRNESDG